MVSILIFIVTINVPKQCKIAKKNEKLDKSKKFWKILLVIIMLFLKLEPDRTLKHW